jgi:hypothetical protein
MVGDVGEGSFPFRLGLTFGVGAAVDFRAGAGPSASSRSAIRRSASIAWSSAILARMGSSEVSITALLTAIIVAVTKSQSRGHVVSFGPPIRIYACEDLQFGALRARYRLRRRRRPKLQTGL